MSDQNVRKVALEVLLRVEKEGGFSHLLLSQAMKKERVASIDESLLTEIVYGTMERKLTLDFYLQPFIQKQKHISEWVQMLLRMSVFQMEFLDKIPPYAVINEAVNIAKRKGHQGIAAFVNGVLRSIQRKGVPKIENIKDPIEQLSIKTSHPLWLVTRWIEAYGFETAKKICETNMEKKPLTVRVNSLKTTKENVLAILEEEKIEAIPSLLIDQAIIIRKGNILKTNLLARGYVTVQDESSMLAASLLQIEKQMTVLDACSAPGGKATFLAEKMENTGTIYAYDLHKNKVKLIAGHAERLGITNIVTKANDARNLQQVHELAFFDRILVDAPCSGLGVIRSKPDIKYNKQLEDIERLHTVQLEILQEVAPLLKKDGKLVYSTCTIELRENEQVVQQFLQMNPMYRVDTTFIDEMKNDLFAGASVTEFGVQLFPHTFNSDGFFITRFIKVVDGNEGWKKTR